MTIKIVYVGAGEDPLEVAGWRSKPAGESVQPRAVITAPEAAMRDLAEITRLIEVYPPEWRRWCYALEQGGCACLGCVRQPAPSTVHGDPEGQPFPNPADRLTEDEVLLYRHSRGDYRPAGAPTDDTVTLHFRVLHDAAVEDDGIVVREHGKPAQMVVFGEAGPVGVFAVGEPPPGAVAEAVFFDGGEQRLTPDMDIAATRDSKPPITWPETVPDEYAGRPVIGRRVGFAPDGADCCGPLEIKPGGVSIVGDETRDGKPEGMSDAEWQAAAITGARALEDARQAEMREQEEEEKERWAARSAAWETALIRCGHVPKIGEDGLLYESIGDEHYGPTCDVCSSVWEWCCEPDPEEAEIEECSEVLAMRRRSELAMMAGLMAKYPREAARIARGEQP